MFVDTHITEIPKSKDSRPSPESFLKIVEEKERAKLRVYIGAAAGVGKTFQMLEDAHILKTQGVDIVIGCVETHGRNETEEKIGDLEFVPMKKIEYRGTIFDELNVEKIIERKPEVVLIDELAHTNIEGSKNQKRFEDVLEILAAGISVMTAVNVQHLETLNDVIARTTGIKVRETIPDWFLRRADEVINVDVSVDTLRTRMRQGKIYGIEKIEQSLNNFFRKSNLSVLRELTLRQVADEQAAQTQDYYEMSGIEQPAIPEKVMVALASRGSAKKLLRKGARFAGRLATDWFIVYVETPAEAPEKISLETAQTLHENIEFGEKLGGQFVRLKGKNVSDELIKFANEHSITHVIFGQSARTRWEIFWKGSIINRFLRDVKDANVHVVPISEDAENC